MSRRLSGSIAALSGKRPTYEPIIIKEELTWRTSVCRSSPGSGTFPRMELIHAQRGSTRAMVAAHVIGYVGEVSENELNGAEFIEYEQGDVVGNRALSANTTSTYSC
ncbi:MAG: hypothetical protein WKF37_12205 [Bryobacteraceae bacterium]